MGLPVLGLVLSIGASFMQAGYASQAAKAEAEVKNEQLKADIENERIAALEKSNSRLEQYQRLEAANRVNVAINGGGMGARDFSYEQGIAPYNKEVAKRDVSNIAFNSGQEIGRMRYAIKVNKFEAKSTAKAAMVGAVADSMSQIGAYVSRPGGLLGSS